LQDVFFLASRIAAARSLEHSSEHVTAPRFARLAGIAKPHSFLTQLNSGNGTGSGTGSHSVRGSNMEPNLIPSYIYASKQASIVTIAVQFSGNCLGI
jgi:hypothetical protein